MKPAIESCGGGQFAVSSHLKNKLLVQILSHYMWALYVSHYNYVGWVLEPTKHFQIEVLECCRNCNHDKQAAVSLPKKLQLPK